MKKFILNRILHLIPVLLGITLLSFFLVNAAAADVIDLKESNTGGVMSEAEKTMLRKDLGLDKPLIEQYGVWLFHVLKGDMGESFVSGKPVLFLFRSKLPATVHLAVVSFILTIIISVPLGIFSAVRQNRFSDYMIRFFSFMGNSMPNFFVSLLLIYFFSLKLKLLPVMEQSGSLKGVILPAATLTISMASKYTRQIRAAVLEEMNKGYVQGARARGVREQRILFFSVLKSAMLTIVTLLSLSIGSLLGGTAVVESIFMWDGVGKMAVDAIAMRDYPVIEAYVIWMAVIYVGINLVTDIFYYYLDPRIRLKGESI